VALLREHNKRSTVDGSSTLTALAAVPTVALVPGKTSLILYLFFYGIVLRRCDFWCMYCDSLLARDERLLVIFAWLFSHALCLLFVRFFRSWTGHSGVRQTDTVGVQASASFQHCGRRQSALGGTAQGKYPLDALMRFVLA